MSERGPLRRRFEVSASDQRSLARVRMVSAVLAFLGAGSMLLSKLPLPVFLIACLGLAIACVWFFQARRASRAAHADRRDALHVHTRGLWIDESGRNAWLPWEVIENIDVDEERLDVVVTRRGSPPLRIEPRYSGIDIHELVRILNDARHAAGRPE